MNLKTKIARRALAWIVAVVMVVSSIGLNSSFLAFANEQQEIEFCVDKMKNLPTNDEFLKAAKKLPNKEELKEARGQKVFQSNGTSKLLEQIVHSDGSEEYVDINEKAIYQNILDLVFKITKELQTDMEKADAIYRWVAENIDYDFESFDATKQYCDKSNKTLAERKPQDAYFVFAKKTGVCEGYARLLHLMMRMAGIPCMYVGSICGPTQKYGHAFNAVYMEDEGENRKGWTLLDSCWAAPGGSDGDAKIKKHLSGEDFLSKFNMENILVEKNDYTDELYNELGLSENCLEKTNQEFVDGLNKKIPNILKQLNDKYKDSSHFETIEFFLSDWGDIHFKYKTDITMTKAKQAKDKLKEIEKRQNCEETINCLTGKSRIDCKHIPSADINKDDFYLTIGENLIAAFCYIHDKNLENTISDYCYKLEKSYKDILFSNLDSAKGNIEKINAELNKKLGELNEKYGNITTIQKINLSVEKRYYGDCIAGTFDTGLSEEKMQELFDKCYQEHVYQVEAKEKFKEYFPAFYNKDQSFEEANRSIFKHTVHKISKFETDLHHTDSQINRIYLDEFSHEGSARIIFKYNGNDTASLTDEILSYGLPIGMNLSSGLIDKLVLKNVESIYLDDNVVINEIDTADSDKYILENGVLYGKTDNGGKSAILKFYDGAYRSIGYVKKEVRKECEKRVNEMFHEYEKRRNEMWKEHEKRRDETLQEYEKRIDEMWKEYDKRKDEMWQECEKRIDEMLKK